MLAKNRMKSSRSYHSLFFSVIFRLSDNNQYRFVSTKTQRLADERAEMCKSSTESEIMRTTLDPLLFRLTSDYIDDHDLSAKLQDLFEVELKGLCYFTVISNNHLNP